ncbi:hypothetical protein EC991_003043 [Linnemannia zychae]|nr:hypothetical protein EC991_003043 [Linnemannia zychae]
MGQHRQRLSSGRPSYQAGAVLKVVYDEDEQSLRETLESSFWPTRQFRRASRLVTEHRLLTAVSAANALSEHKSIIDILSHTFFYHDDSKPRLFIVLPTRDGNTGGFLDEFRLYYLCECGEHSRQSLVEPCTLALNDTVYYNIHLVDSEEYRIANPAAFFKKYGEYILVILRMVKHGAFAAGMVAPCLLQFGAMTRQESAEFGNKVDYAIRYLEQQQLQRYLDPSQTPKFSLTAATESNDFAGAFTNTRHRNRNVTKGWLANEKFGDLDSLLEDHDYTIGINSDKKRYTTPANLHRITTVKEGYVRWICEVHYNKLYQYTTREYFYKFLRLNQGALNVHTGIAKVKISTVAQAKIFYMALLNTPFLQELHITLDSIISPYDLEDIIDAVGRSNLQKVELFAHSNTPDFSDGEMFAECRQPQAVHLRLSYNDLRRIQLKNREGLNVNVRKWPNTANTNALSLTGCTQRDFSILYGVLRSAPHLTRISLDVDDIDFDIVMDLVEAHIEQYKKVETLSLFRKDDFKVTMSFESGSTVPSQTDATISSLDLVTSRIPLESITDLTLNDKHTASEVDVLVQVLLACCSSLKNLCLSLVNTPKDQHSPLLSIYELGSIPTMASVRLDRTFINDSSHLTFPLTKLDLSYLSDPFVNIAGFEKIIATNPSLATLVLKVDDLDDAYEVIEPFVRRHERDMTVRLKHLLGDYAVIRFQHSTKPVDATVVSTIELHASIGKLKHFPLDKVETLSLPVRSLDCQHGEILEVTQRCTSLKALEIDIGHSLPLSAFFVSSLPSLKSIHFIKTRNQDHSTFHSLPLERLNLAGTCLVSVIGGVTAVEEFFRRNPLLNDVSFTVSDLRTNLAVFLTVIKSLQTHKLLKFTLKDHAGSVASILFDKENNKDIASYSLHLKSCLQQEDFQTLDLSSVTDFSHARLYLANIPLDTFFNKLVTECPRLESIDIHCGTKYLPSFLQAIDIASLKKCVLRNASGQVSPSVVKGYLNIGNELLPNPLFPVLQSVLKSRPKITGLKVLVESTFEACEFFVSLAAEMPWLQEVKISQQSVGPKVVISFADDIVAGSGRVWTIALDVRSLSQIPPSMLPLLTKLTVSGLVKQWTSQDLDEIPLASCENLSVIELKCPPSQFSRILGWMHEAALMHTSLHRLKLWDGSRDSILTGEQIDDLDAIAIKLQRVRLTDFEISLQELKALLQDYPVEIEHLELDPRFNLYQAEVIEESLKVGKVRIRNIQWDISAVKNVRLFETMFWAISRIHANAAASKMVPKVTFKVCNQAVSRPVLALHLPTTDSQKSRMLSTLGQFMTRFATHLILVHSGLESLLPDLYDMELRALQELDIRVSRYCPDDKFLGWLESVIKRPTVQVPASSQLIEELVESGEHNGSEDSYDADFDFDDPMSSSIIFGDTSSPPSPVSTMAPPLVFSQGSSSTVQQASAVPFAEPANLHRQPFRRLTLHNLHLTPPQWKKLLKSMDFVSLRLLSLERVGFGDGELQLLTTLYIDQITQARKQREENKEKGVVVGGYSGDDEDDEGDEEEKEEEEGEFVVRLYTTSVTQSQIDTENARLMENNCLLLKFVCA